MVGRRRIYDRVRANGKGGGSPLTHLRRRGRKRNRQGGRHAGRGHIPGRRDIPERPETVGEKVGTGDREADTVIGRGHGGAVVSPVDRVSKQPPVQRVDGKRAEVVRGAMTDLPEGPGARVHTITADSGREFAERAKVAKAPGAGFLLPTPHHPWERGLNGHTDGPPRRHLPKGTDFRQVTDARVKEVRDILNARPGKVPGHLTPAEAFARARPPRGHSTRRTAGESFRRTRPGLRPGHPLPCRDRRATSRRGALRPPERPVTLRSEGTAAAFRVGSGSLAGKSLNPGPPLFHRRAGY